MRKREDMTELAEAVLIVPMAIRAAAEAEPTSLHQKQKLFQRQLRKVQKNKDIFSYSSTLHLLACLQRTRSFWRQPYEDLAPKTLMKTSFQRAFDPKSSQG